MSADRCETCRWFEPGEYCYKVKGEFAEHMLGDCHGDYPPFAAVKPTSFCRHHTPQDTEEAP